MTFIKNQFDIIYNDNDLEFCRNIKRLGNNIIINTFLISFDEYKYE